MTVEMGYDGENITGPSDSITPSDTPRQPRGLHLDGNARGRPSGRLCHFYYSNAAETRPNIVEWIKYPPTFFRWVLA